jgi:hypothetical protein
MLGELIKVGRLDTHDLATPPVDLARDRRPEHLVKHRVGHVVVRAAFLALGHREGVLSISGGQGGRQGDIRDTRGYESRAW